MTFLEGPEAEPLDSSFTSWPDDDLLDALNATEIMLVDFLREDRTREKKCSSIEESPPVAT